MTKLPQQQHDDALSDVIWWLKGFAANNPDNQDVYQMQDGLRNLRTWLDRLGKPGFATTFRTVGTDRDDIRIVITEADFDRINDGLTDIRNDDCQFAKRLMEGLRTEYVEELKPSEVPF